MKKKFSFLMATILACALNTNVWADVTWTDYTSKLTNPSFETGDPMSKPNSGYQTTCEGWTLAPSSASYSQMGIVATGATIQGVATSLTAPAGSQYFYIRNNWNADKDYNITQTISNTSTLPVGMYKLTCKMITYSDNWSTCSHTVSLAESGGQTSAKTMYSTGSNWTDVTVLLYKASATSDLTIKANLRAGSSGSGQHYQLIVDDFQLYYCEDLGATQSSSVDVTDYISNPSIQNTNTGYVPRGWTAGSRKVGNDHYTAGTDDTQLEAWSGSSMYFDYYQTLNGLPEGLYQLSAKCHDSNAKGGKLYATTSSTTKSTSMTSDYSTITTEKISVSDGTLKIGIMSETTSGGSWMTGDDFTLSYLGYDLTEALNELQTLYDECSAYDLTQKMNASYKVNFENALQAANGVLKGTTSQTKTNIDNAKLQLTNTYTSVQNSVATYAAITAKYNTLDQAGKAAFIGTETGAKYYYNTLADEEWWSDYQMAVKAQTTENSNFTDLITNPSFETGTTDGWTANKANDTGVYPNSNATYTISNADGNYIFNTWGGSDTKYIEQSLTDLPVGIYAVTVLIASDAGNTVTLTDGTNSTSITASTDGKGTGVDGTLSSIAVTDGNLKIRLESTSWYKADNFRLTYLRNGATEDESNALTDRYNAVKDLKMNSTISSALGTAYTDFTTNNTTVTYKALQDAVIAAENSVASYAAITEKYNAMDEAGKDAFIGTETGKKYNDNTLADEDWWSDYQTALRAQGVGATLTDLISNPDFKTSDVSGWNLNDKATPTVKTDYHNCEFYMKDFDMSQTITNLKKGTYEITVQAFQRPGEANTDLATNYKADKWTSLASLYTTAQNSDVTHICAAWQDLTESTPEWIKNYSTITYNETSYAIPNGMEGGRAWFDQKEDGVGFYTVTAKATVTEEGGSLTFGFRGNMSSTNYAWLIFDNFTLKYISADVLVDEAESEKLITTATGLESEVMQGSVKDALTAAKNDLSSDKTNGTKYKTLNDAITAAQASVEAYSNLNTALTNYGAKAEALGGEYTNSYNTAVSSIQKGYDECTLSTADANAAVTTIAEAYETQRQAKNYDEYTTAKTNCPDTYTVTFSGTCSSEGKGQHWDGTSDTKYYDNWSASAASYSNTATVTLPSGDYAFVAAGRGQNVADSYISVKVGENEATTYHFNMKGDAGYGIDTDGNATFANDATYANTTGRGWEWGTISFTLPEATEVTLTFGYDLAANSWASISNPALLCTKAVTAKVELAEAIAGAPSVPTANISETEPFKWNKTKVEAITSAISTAQGVYDSYESDEQTITEQTDIINALGTPSINMLSEAREYGAKLVYNGWNYDKKYISFYVNEQTTGGYSGGYFDLGEVSKYQELTFTPIQDSENYIISFTDADNVTRYMCTGVPYDGNTSQIRTTTEASSALAVTVMPSLTKEGIVNLWNTEAGNYIGSQDQGVYTVNSHTDFTLDTISYTRNVTIANLGTICVPYKFNIPDYLTLYQIVGKDDNYVYYDATIDVEAGKPYLFSSRQDNIKLSYIGTPVEAPVSSNNGLVGTFTEVIVPNGCYILSANELYCVDNQFTCGANRAYLNIDAITGGKPANIKSGFALGFDAATGIANVDADADADIESYNLSGQKVANGYKGVVIKNGRKYLKR